MAKVIIVTNDGAIHTDPREVKIVRSEKNEQFYEMLENFVPKDETA